MENLTPSVSYMKIIDVKLLNGRQNQHSLTDYTNKFHFNLKNSKYIS
ncbi:MAG: hypothetical protein ACTTJ6_06410 [Treponema sp.]